MQQNYTLWMFLFLLKAREFEIELHARENSWWKIDTTPNISVGYITDVAGSAKIKEVS